MLRPDDPSRSDRVTHVELLFDLVSAFALIQLSAYVNEHQTLLGALEGAIMITALWWAWVATNWVTKRLDPVRLPVRVAVIAIALLTLVMNVSIADSFGDRAWVFAIAYVALQVGLNGFILLVSWRHDREIAVDFSRLLARTAASGALWILSALLPLPAQLPLWVAALALELLGTRLGYPVPGNGRVEVSRGGISRARILPSAPRCSC